MNAVVTARLVLVLISKLLVLEELHSAWEDLLRPDWPK